MRSNAYLTDPLSANPLAQALRYSIPVERVLCSILLGIVTYDANMLIIEPQQERPQGSTEDKRRQASPSPAQWERVAER